MWRWFFLQNELRAATAAVAAEAPELAATRRRVRELWDAARLLELSPEIAPEPRAALYEEALRVASAGQAPAAITTRPLSVVRSEEASLEVAPAGLEAESSTQGAADLASVAQGPNGLGLAGLGPLVEAPWLEAPKAPQSTSVAETKAPAPVGLAGLRTAHQEALARLERNLNARDRIIRGSAMRWGTLVFSLAVTAVMAQLIGSKLLAPKDLAEGKPWKTSTVGLVCTPAQHVCGGTKTDIFFHTSLEQNPWFEIDLGAPTAFSRMSIHNRQDMGVGRAVPMVVEVGDDGVNWSEVARQTTVFDVWKPSFPQVTARHIRLRIVDKKTWFHLEAVKVHP